MENVQPPFNGEREKIRQEMENRLKKVKMMNATTVLSHGLPNDDLAAMSNRQELYA